MYLFISFRKTVYIVLMFLNANGIDLYYEIIGEGTPIIFLHGNGEDHSIFYRAAYAMKDQYRVYLLDSRGHGQSSHVDTLHYSDMAEDVAAFIQTLDIENPLICGFSDGGIVALLVAAQYPELVDAIITCGANSNPQGIKKRFLMEMQKDYQETGNELARLMVSEPNIDNLTLRKIVCPALILTGENDIIKLKDSSFIASNIKNSELRVLSGEDHGSYIYDSDRIVTILEEEKAFLYN